ncbi:CoA pyrophosphatase [Halalkalibacterium halodurans]|nr:CoA pyrophosphatase [Halalkalibacterium halodurans]
MLYSKEERFASGKREEDFVLHSLQQLKSQLLSYHAGILGEKYVKKSAVFIPLVEKDDGVHVLFEVRAHTLKQQPGEICFPGGRIDPEDASPEEAAIRETSEELGIPSSVIAPITSLDVLVTPFRGIIYPVIGSIPHKNDYPLNQAEVDHVFTVPIDHFISHPPEQYRINVHFEPGAGFPIERIANQSAYQKSTRQITESFYYYQSYVIWGLTAKILRHVITILKPS